MKHLTNLSVVIKAFGYALKGLRYAASTQRAFQQELILGLIFVPTSLLLNLNIVERLLLIGSWMIVLITELVNTALETIVNLVSPEQHKLAGAAKDLGSAAVLLSLLFAALTWAAVLSGILF